MYLNIQVIPTITHRENLTRRATLRASSTAFKRVRRHGNGVWRIVFAKARENFAAWNGLLVFKQFLKIGERIVGGMGLFFGRGLLRLALRGRFQQALVFIVVAVQTQ